MTELEKHLRAGLPELEKQFRAEMMTKIDNVVCELESRGYFSDRDDYEISIENYRRVAVDFLNDVIIKRDWLVNFDEILISIAENLKNREVDSKKKRSTELLIEINKNPTDELYVWADEAQFNADSYLESNTNPVVEHWNNRLTKLIASLERRRAVVGTFNKKTIKKELKVIKPFYEHLKHDKPKELADICKEIFNRNDSPKDYAIMLALLSYHDLIVVANRKRSDFYSSWYDLIKKTLPKKNNFYSINKFIDDKSGYGFDFKDTDDGDYRQLSSIFEKSLISIK